MKFILSSLLCLALYASQASASQCDAEADLVNSAHIDYSEEPITILSQDTDSVTFTVSQTWSDDMLCLIATHYTGGMGEVCPDVPNAAPGVVATYTAQCVGGFATVDLYVFEPSFMDNTSPPTIPGVCEQTAVEKTYLYQYSIPCGGTTCPAPTDIPCEYMDETDYDFEDATDVDDWLFGKEGTDNGNKFLQLDAETLEVSKTLEIPSGTTGVEFVFDFLAVSPLPEDQKLYIRVGDYYLNITSVQDMAVSGESNEYFAEIQVHIERPGAAETYRVTVTVPEELYNGDYLSLGFRTTGSSTSFVAGLDNVSINLSCDATRSPTMTPAMNEDSEFEGGTQTGGGGGDPHFQRWGREHSSFHGECDLVMVHSDQFHNHAGLDLHVRTTIQDYFSYIEAAALRVGESTLEFHQKFFYLDGTKYTPEDLPLTFGDEFKYTVSNGEIEIGKNAAYYQYFKVDLHEDSTILFKYYKKFLTIAIEGHSNDFSDSVGLLGDYNTGNMISRDGLIMNDFDQYGFEWQVNPEDAKLFMDARAPQLPFEQCRMPTAARPARRKLRGGDSALYEQAQKACAHVNGGDLELCIDDVMATGDEGLASLW